MNSISLHQKENYFCLFQSSLSPHLWHSLPSFPPTYLSTKLVPKYGFCNSLKWVSRSSTSLEVLSGVIRVRCGGMTQINDDEFEEMGMWRLTKTGTGIGIGIGIGGQLGVWKLSLPLLWDFHFGSNSNVSLKTKKIFLFFPSYFLRKMIK